MIRRASVCCLCQQQQPQCHQHVATYVGLSLPFTRAKAEFFFVAIVVFALPENMRSAWDEIYCSAISATTCARHALLVNAGTCSTHVACCRWGNCKRHHHRKCKRISRRFTKSYWFIWFRQIISAHQQFKILVCTAFTSSFVRRQSIVANCGITRQWSRAHAIVQAILQSAVAASIGNVIMTKVEPEFSFERLSHNSDTNSETQS